MMHMPTLARCTYIAQRHTDEDTCSNPSNLSKINSAPMYPSRQM